jgi:hypothetical protein
MRLAGKLQTSEIDAVHADVDAIGERGGVEDGRAIAAGRDDREAEAGLAGRREERWASSGVPSGTVRSRASRKLRTPSNRGFPST